MITGPSAGEAYGSADGSSNNRETNLLFDSIPWS